MDEDKIRHLLSSLKIPQDKATFTGSVKNTRWMTVSCPFAPWTHAKKTDHNPSFGITVKPDGRSSYKCLSCGVKGRLAGLPTRLGGYRKQDYSKLRQWAEGAEFTASSNKPLPKWEDADPVAIDYIDKSNKPVAGSVNDFPLALGSAYLRKRGLSYIDIMRLNLRYDSFQRRVLFPVYDQFDNFCGFTGRSTIEGNNDTKGKNPKVRDYYGLKKRELFLGLPGQPAGIRLLVEGLFDYANLVRLGYKATRAIMGTSITPEKRDILIQQGEPVYFFMDNDLAGWQAVFGIFDSDGNLMTDNAWAYSLYSEIPVWIVPYSTQFGGEDPGSLFEADKVHRMIRNAWLFTGKAPLLSGLYPTFRHPARI